MKFKILYFFLLAVSTVFAQEDFEFKTEFKLKPNGEVAFENYNFSFFPKKGKLIRKDLDLGHEKVYWIKFYDSQYSSNGDKYIVLYSTDFETHFAKENNKKDVNSFTLVYDKKLGNILFFKINSLSDNAESFYLTKLGKEIRSSENN